MDLPPTKGRVRVVSSVGTFHINLFPVHAPKACRNFLGLCLRHYYDGCPVWRVIKDQFLQTGDPTGEGTGGIAFEDPIETEPHPRLKFKAAGLVCTAGEDNMHESQFMITLGAMKSLQGRQTIFGVVSPESIGVLQAMSSVDVDDDGRPANPPVILSIDVVDNPMPELGAAGLDAELKEDVAEPDAEAQDSVVVRITGQVDVDFAAIEPLAKRRRHKRKKVVLPQPEEEKPAPEAVEGGNETTPADPVVPKAKTKLGRLKRLTAKK
ncbi:Cyclophilin type peptidyl-prolyl cis-trans isomerase/CLD [Carpediemonas membranifera]|uniref:Cyclophilin type peptidyl-prolyl cis-trans isomerase/CLD n=1 Tax=Carpediemonas membranifera TaxID=201153 RepID=A0A8J6E0A9_9EUKA|nr:Cyclophilin type peptidyl-prolyl cis-trans isomerase/CLD [Carpediemonas membranifera]|eukprot:KAG9391943.1 Cyclophilin type peptidyl-prolyl cis-trans isomerase/CLD [Carpediemonas membranifera]